MQVKQLDNKIVGLIAGLLVPVIMAYLIYKLNYSGHDSFIDLVKGLYQLKSLGKLLSVSVVPNLIIFFLSLTMEAEKNARGIMIATIFWAVITGILFLVN